MTCADLAVDLLDVLVFELGVEFPEAVLATLFEDHLRHLRASVQASELGCCKIVILQLLEDLDRSVLYLALVPRSWLHLAHR